MTPDPKPGKKKKKKRPEDTDYKTFIRSLPCLICGKNGSVHHHESLEGSGMGMKCNDKEAIPLCVECHHQRHHIGRSTFYGKHDLNYYDEVIRYQLLYDNHQHKY